MTQNHPNPNHCYEDTHINDATKLSSITLLIRCSD